MKSKDLRIGNLVYNFFTRENIIVCPQLFSHLSHVNELDITTGLGGILPISLNKYWLLKSGFGMENESYFSIPRRTRTNKSNYSLIYTKDLNGDWYILIDESIKVYIKCVHELQNLYFALTGEELELKHESKP